MHKADNSFIAAYFVMEILISDCQFLLLIVIDAAGSVFYVFHGHAIILLNIINIVNQVGVALGKLFAC